MNGSKNKRERKKKGKIEKAEVQEKKEVKKRRKKGREKKQGRRKKRQAVLGSTILQLLSNHILLLACHCLS